MSQERRLLQETCVRFIDATWPLDRVRRRVDGQDLLDRDEQDYLRRAGELGWFSCLVDEEHGGGSASGQGVLDAVVVGQERGRVLQPGDWVSGNVAASAIQALGTAEQRSRLLPDVAAGVRTAGWLAGDALGDSRGALCMRPAGEGLMVSGTTILNGDRVPDVLVAACALPNGSLVQVLLPTASAELSVEPLATLDLSRPASRLHLREVLVDVGSVLGPALTDGGVQELLTLGALLSTAEAIGTMEALLAMTVQYAKDRTAFGRPIGSFQGIKHALADAAMRLECCRAVLAGAARDVQAGEPWAAEVVSMLKSFTADTAGALAQQCLQVHGGIGFTWEHDLHLYYRRLAVEETAWGSATWHRERICSLHSL